MGHLFENQHKTPRFRDMPKMTTKLRDPTGKKMGRLIHDRGALRPLFEVTALPKPQDLRETLPNGTSASEGPEAEQGSFKGDF